MVQCTVVFSKKKKKKLRNFRPDLEDFSYESMSAGKSA